MLYIDADYLITDSVDEDGNYDTNMFVSREVFDFIIKGLKENKYTRLVESEE